MKWLLRKNRMSFLENRILLKDSENTLTQLKHNLNKSINLKIFFIIKKDR